MASLDPFSLRLFVRVVEEGTIARAAEREHVVAGAISKRLSEMEAVLGTPLLVRSNRGVQPTAAGSALLTMARKVLHELDQLPFQMRGYAAGLSGLVRVASSMSAILQFLPFEIQGFLAKHPNVQIQLEETRSAPIPKLIADNATDIGIFTGPTQGQHIEVFDYHVDRLVIVVPQAHPLSLRKSVRFADALDHVFIGLQSDSAIHLGMLSAANQLERELSVRIQVSSLDAMCLMVSAGLGIGVMPEAVAGRAADAGSIRIVGLNEPWAERTFHLGVRSKQALSAAGRMLLEHLRGSVQSG